MKEFELFGLKFSRISNIVYYCHSGFEITYDTLLKKVSLYRVSDYFDRHTVKMPFKSLSKNLNTDTIKLLETPESLAYLLKHRRQMEKLNCYNPALEDLKCLDRYEILL
jgi:hypothetical protein